MVYFSVFITAILLFLVAFVPNDHGCVSQQPPASLHSQVSSRDVTQVTEAFSQFRHFQEGKNFNTYEDSMAKFSFLYPQYLKSVLQGKDEIIFAEDEHSPWIVDVSFGKTPFKNFHEWMMAENLKRPHDLKIKFQKFVKIGDREVTFFSAPVIIDHTENKSPLYDQQEIAIFIKEYVLYRFTLREGLSDSLKEDFYKIVASFKSL